MPISVTEPAAAARARSASRIHQTMLRSDVDSTLLVVDNESGGDRVLTARPSRNPFRRVYRHALRTLYGIQDHIDLLPTAPCHVFTSDRSFRRAEVLRDLRCPQIIHLHWVAEMFDERVFLPAATRIAPVIWTMRDMRPITGGCHNNENCRRYREGCGHCPQLAQPGPQDISHRIWQRRQKTLSEIPVVATDVCVPESMARCGIPNVAALQTVSSSRDP